MQSMSRAVLRVASAQLLKSQTLLELTPAVLLITKNVNCGKHSESSTILALLFSSACLQQHCQLLGPCQPQRKGYCCLPLPLERQDVWLAHHERLWVALKEAHWLALCPLLRSSGVSSRYGRVMEREGLCESGVIGQYNQIVGSLGGQGAPGGGVQHNWD